MFNVIQNAQCPQSSISVPRKKHQVRTQSGAAHKKEKQGPEKQHEFPYGRRQERQTSLDEVGDVDLQARISSFASRNDILQIMKCRDRTFQDLELVADRCGDFGRFADPLDDWGRQQDNCKVEQDDEERDRESGEKPVRNMVTCDAAGDRAKHRCDDQCRGDWK